MTTLATPPRIRLRPAPACDPPIDDQDGPGARPPSLPQPPLPAPGDPVRQRSRPAPAAPAAATPGPSGQTREAARRFMHTCLEILNGYRPVAHFRALSDPLAAASVLDAMTRGSRRLTAAAGGHRAVTLRRMRVCEPRPGAAEISAVLATRTPKGRAASATASERCFAAAFRLEHRHGRWLCHVARLL